MASTDTRTAADVARDLNSVVRTLTLLREVYSQTNPDAIDAQSYTAGFHAGARAAYNDAITRVEEAVLGVEQIASAPVRIA